MTIPLCEVCKDSPAHMAALYRDGPDVTPWCKPSFWCENCAGPEIAGRVFHYTITVRPISAIPEAIRAAAALLAAGWTPPHPLVTEVNKLATNLAAEIASTQAEIEKLQDAAREDPSVAEAVRQLEAAIEQAQPPNIDAT